MPATGRPAETENVSLSRAANTGRAVVYHTSRLACLNGEAQAILFWPLRNKRRDLISVNKSGFRGPSTSDSLSWL